MSKCFPILAFYVLLLVCVQGLSSLESEKNPFNPNQIQFKPNKLVEIGVDSKHHQKMVVGLNGTFFFTTEFDDSITNIFDSETLEQESSFSTILIDQFNQNVYSKCRLWKPTEIIIILCEGNFFENGFHSVRIRNQTFEYKNRYLIHIAFYGEENFFFGQVNMNLPFIYSLKQNINIIESQSSYELKFKFNSYRNEPLYIYGTKNNYLILDNCENIDKELICQISKEKIEEVFVSKDDQFRLSSMSDTYGIFYCDLVYPITITYENVQKEDIYIKLEKLVGTITELGTPFAFETNVTEIPNLISDRSNALPNAFSYFKKMTGKPLMLFIEYSSERENMPAPSFPNELVLSDIHYKYNFRIQPFQFNEIISIQNFGTKVSFVYPEKINFISSNSETIRLIMDKPHLANGIKLNPESKSYLECEDLNEMKKCIVPQSHFNWKKSGYYNTYHMNHEGDLSIYFDAPLIDVTLPEKETELYIEFEDNQNIKYIGNKGILNFVLDYNDNTNNIFDTFDIEEKTTFETTICIDKLNTYNVICKLWKPIDEKLNMFCKLNNNLGYGSHSFEITSSSFYYNDRKFTIIQHTDVLSLFQLDKKIPFLYSSKQVINIDEKIDTYDLKFKIGEYNNELLSMKEEYTGSIILNKCSVEGTNLICKIEKDIIEEFAPLNGAEFSISYYLFDDERSIDTDLNLYSIYGIYINNPLNKEDIYPEIIEVPENNINYNNYIAYEKNMKDIKFYEASSFKDTLSETINIDISIKKENNENTITIGSEGVFALVTDYNNKEKNYNISHINFASTLIDENYIDEYNVNCRFWVLNEDNLRIICTFNNSYEFTSSELYLKRTVIYDSNYKITIVQDEPIVFVSKNNSHIPFVYSDRQTINIFANIKFYELKFNIEENSYSKDLLYIYGSNNNYAILDNCKNDLKELTCEISLEKIEEILVKSNEQFKIGAMNDDIGIIPFMHILDITMIYKYPQKEDIFLEIKEIVGATTEIGVPVGFVTNVTEIPNFISAKFEVNKYFKKVSGKPLMLFYSYSSEIEVDIKSSDTEEKIIKDIHYKYNFRIQPSRYEGHISVKENGTNILLVYPQELNYYSKQSFKIRYIFDEPELANELKLNPNSSQELNCRNLYKMKVCEVSNSHFNMCKGGFFYTSHFNHNNNHTIYYYSSTIKITLPIEIIINQKDNQNEINVGYNGMIYLKSNFDDNEDNIFDDSNIEENTKFTTAIICDNDYYYDTSCYLWKNDENIVYIFCKLYDNIGIGPHSVNIKEGNFIYNKLKINIISNLTSLNVNQLETYTPFLYSKRQTINIEEGTDTYYMKFTIVDYQNEKLIISYGPTKYILLDKCSVEKKELICSIEKSELEEIPVAKILIHAYCSFSMEEKELVSLSMVGEIFINHKLPKTNLKITIKQPVENHFDLKIILPIM